jgi:hypothetical protein
MQRRHNFHFHSVRIKDKFVRESSVGVAMGWTAGVRSPAGTVDLSLLRRVQPGSGAQPASYPMGTGGSFPDGKVAGA